MIQDKIRLDKIRLDKEGEKRGQERDEERKIEDIIRQERFKYDII